MRYRAQSSSRGFWGAFFGTLVALVVFIFVLGGLLYWKANEQPGIDDHSYLLVDLYGPMLEYPPAGGLMAELTGGEPETLHRVLSNLEKAAVDDRIEGVILKVSSSSGMGGGMAWEIRGAVHRVRDAGKKVYAFSDSFDRSSYLVMAACDSIFAPPSANITIVGYAAVSQHLRGALDKLGIKPNLHKIKDYKSAAEMVLRKDMSPEAREMYEWLLDEAWDLTMEAMEKERGLTEDDVVALMQHAAFTGEEAKEAGLLDELLYWDQLEARLRREKDDELRTVSQCRYADVERAEVGLKGKKTVAVVHAQGMIGGRATRVDPLLGVMMGHESVIEDLRRAREDEDVAAVVFRVDSGGGEGLASDLISREVGITAAEKPVVVSMVDVAASGGYYIAYQATKMVANPVTMTGSIGSISGKFNSAGFWSKLGITHDHVERGPMALLWWSGRDFTNEERTRFEQNHWDGFNDWLEDVAEHRGMTFEEAEALAHGRVWSGRQAKANGLIDDLGGLHRAVELAKELAEIPAGETVKLVHYPEPQGLVDVLLGGGDVTAAVRYAVYHTVRTELAETWRLLAGARLEWTEPVDLR